MGRLIEREEGGEEEMTFQRAQNRTCDIMDLFLLQFSYTRTWIRESLLMTLSHHGAVESPGYKEFHKAGGSESKS